MELEHRFELPVGIATAWAALTDIKTLGPCFPGATVDEVDANGRSFGGSVKLKLGRGPWTYRGRGTIEQPDARAHRARVEVSGTAARAASTAAMLVSLTATAITESRTEVELLTTLSITGRPSRFGRDVLLEKSNDLVSQFADNLSEELTGRPTGGAELLDVLDPDQVAADIVSDTAQEKVVGSSSDTADTADTAGRGDTADAAGRQAAHRYRNADDSDETGRTGLPVLRRVVPIGLAISAVLLLRRLFSRRDPDSDTDNATDANADHEADETDENENDDQE